MRRSVVSDAVTDLRRWADSGAIWQVIARTAGGIEVALLTCDAGEEVARLRSADPELLAYVGDRDRSDQGET
jgi:hypothetical protein